MIPDLWGKTKRPNSRRRFVKVLGQMPAPFGLALEDYSRIYNVVTVEFDYVDISTFPPQVLSRCRTPLANDRASQDQYGTRARNVWGGAITATDAVALRDEYLRQYAQPRYDIDRR